MTNSFWDLPIATIEKALNIRRQIEALNGSLNEIFGGAAESSIAEPVSAKPVDGRKGKRSAAARAKMAAAQKARWAKLRQGGAKASSVAAPAKAPRKKRTMSPEARARIAAAQRARWAKQKAK